MEVDQSRCGRPRTRALLGGAGMAGPQGTRSAGATMKTVAIPLFVAFEVGSAVAFAQGTSDPVADLRACSVMEREARLECLEKLSRSIAPPARPAAPVGDNLVVSETTSPVDYTPIVTATTPSRGRSEGSLLPPSTLWPR